MSFTNPRLTIYRSISWCIYIYIWSLPHQNLPLALNSIYIYAYPTMFGFVSCTIQRFFLAQLRRSSPSNQATAGAARCCNSNWVPCGGCQLNQWLLTLVKQFQCHKPPTSIDDLYIYHLIRILYQPCRVKYGEIWWNMVKLGMVDWWILLLY